MSRSKFTFVQQKRSILKNIPKAKNKEVIQAGIGDDYGRLMLLHKNQSGVDAGTLNEVAGDTTEHECMGSSEIAITEGLCLQNAFGYVRTDIIKLYNKLKVGGYTPIAISDTLMVDEPDEKRMKKILKEICDVADELGLDILYGHTECSSAFRAPAVSVTMYGTGDGYFKASRENHTNSCIKPGMDIVMCGQTGILGTLLLYEENKEALLERYSKDYLRAVEGFKSLLVVKNQAEIAKSCGAVYGHHISTGGVYGALWELAESQDLGLNVCHDNIPIMQETVEICEFTGDNPYMADGCGAILFVTPSGEALSDALYAAGYEASVIGTLTEDNNRIITHASETRFLTPPRYSR